MNMTAADWSLVESVLDRLEDLPGPERPAAVATLCGERPDLVATVENLLRAQDACDEVDFLEEPATVPDEAVDDLDPPPPERLGEFVVGRRIGRGGYGVVYEGLREDVGQRVALKVLRGAAGSTAHGRFRREQRILALLDHPAIPRLIDTGRAESGEIYFAMELVEGEPITDYVRRTNVGLRERLRLFLEACDAVRYAHSRLVVHRDIKPHNVMVTAGDGPARVKVVDFGIAAPLQPDAERLTGTGPPAPMTIAFAAPEQLRGERAEPATDVYGLGLLLFILLTDRLPYRVPRRSHAVMERTVLESVVPNPSGVSPHPWARRLRGDLDHVVQKALAKEAGRRYPTADALQADIRSYLDGLPVSARRPSVVYAAWRAVYRRRAAAVAVLATLLAAGGTYAFGAARQRAAAIRAAEERAVIAEVLADVLGALDGPTGSVPEADAILRAALRAIRRVASRPVYEAELLTLVADRYESLGRHGDAIPLYERAVHLETLHRAGHPAHTEALSGLGRSLVIRRPESRTRDYLSADSLLRIAWRQAAETFGPASPNAGAILAYLGALHYYTGSYELAARYCRNSRRILSMALMDSTAWAAAETRVARAQGAWMGYSMRHNSSRRVSEDLSYATLYLGYAELALGKPRVSIPLLEEVAAYQLRYEPYAYATGAALDALAGAYFEVNAYALSERTYEQSILIMRVVAGDTSTSVARPLGLLVAPLLYSGKIPEALATARESVNIAYATGDSLQVIWQLYNLAYVLRYSGDGAAALAVLDTLVSRIEAATSEHPALPRHHVGALAERSTALLLLGDRRAAEQEARRAVRLASQIADPAITGHARVALAEVLLARGAYEDVLKTLLPQYRHHVAAHIPGNPSLQAVRIARCLARAYRQLGAPDSARYYEREAIRRAPPGQQ